MEKITFRHYIQFLFIASLVYLFGAGLYWGYVWYMSKTPVYCGKIFKKISSIQTHKSSSTNEFIFVIDFEKIGRDEVNVTASTYVSHNEGDTVCFEMRNRNTSLSDVLKGCIVFISYGIVVIAFILGCISSINWIFTGDFELPKSDF